MINRLLIIAIISIGSPDILRTDNRSVETRRPEREMPWGGGVNISPLPDLLHEKISISGRLGLVNESFQSLTWCRGAK